MTDLARLTAVPTTITGVVLLRAEPVRDERGFFARLLDPDVLGSLGLDVSAFRWHSRSRSGHGVVRGLHTRVAPGESKIISCTRGAIADVVVDLRPWSPSFLKHQWFDLSEQQLDQLLLPPGIAHGFQVLSEEADVGYLIDRLHHPADERVVHHLDPDLALDWPAPISTVSRRDHDAPNLDEIRDDLASWFPKEAQLCVQ